MKTNPPSAEDAPLVARMAKIGLVPGQAFDASKLGVFDKEAIRVVPKTAQLKIISHLKEMGKNVNGWQSLLTPGFMARIPGSSADYGYRAWSESTTGCDLSDIGEGCSG